MHAPTYSVLCVAGAIDGLLLGIEQDYLFPPKRLEEDNVVAAVHKTIERLREVRRGCRL
jgi:hypothetical protein